MPSDIDLLCHWLSPGAPVRVSSFGSLLHFRKAGKPAAAGSATRCLECPIERECAYSAKKGESLQICGGGEVVRGIAADDLFAVYYEPVSQGNTHWPASTIVDGVPDIENIGLALRDGPYGRCVYECDNDVCDNQVRGRSRVLHCLPITNAKSDHECRS